MKRYSLLFLMIALCLNGVMITKSQDTRQPGKFRRSANAIPNQYIVVLNENTNDLSMTPVQVEGESRDLTRTYGGRLDTIYSAALKGFSIEMSESNAKAMSSDARVKYVQEDVKIYAAGTQESATWGLDRIDQRTLPLQGNYSFNAHGSGVNAYIIDSGIRRTHVDFGGRVQNGFDAVGDGQNGNDCNGHGTHVAGTVGSTTHGVAKNVTLYPVRVLTCEGYGDASQVLAGIDWVTANHIKPAVANISITVNGIYAPLDDAIAVTVAAGVIVTVAASNNAADACNFSPARTPTALTVGGSDAADQKTGSSNFGPCVDIFAPGTAILSTGFASDTASGVRGGTSMAAPHVAGAAALFLETHRNALPAEVADAIVNDGSLFAPANIGSGSPNLLLFSMLPNGIEPITNIAPSDGSAYIGYPKTITWTNMEGFNHNVTIELSKDGGLTYPITVATNISNTGTFTWMVPVEQTTTARLRVREFDLEAPSGVSSGNFVIGFGPSAGDVTISGRVTDSMGDGLGSVLVSLMDASGQIRISRTSVFGHFSFENVASGSTYVISPTHKRYQFAPMFINVLNDMTDVDFTATE